MNERMSVYAPGNVTSRSAAGPPSLGRRLPRRRADGEEDQRQQADEQAEA